MAVQKLGITKPQIAWAIFTKDNEDDDYIFHSAHWSRSRAKEMNCFSGSKIVKIYFTFNNPVSK